MKGKEVPRGEDLGEQRSTYKNVEEALAGCKAEVWSPGG